MFKTLDTELSYWERLPWLQIKNKLSNLQKRIYQASRRCDHKRMVILQDSLLSCNYIRRAAINITIKDFSKYYLLHSKEKYYLGKSEKIRIFRELINPSPENSKHIKYLAENAKQCLIFWILQPEWLGKFEPACTNNSNEPFQIRIQKFIEENFMYARYEKNRLIIEYEIYSKFIDLKCILNKLQANNWVSFHIKEWMNKQSFMERLQSESLPLFPVKDSLLTFFKKTLVSGIEWFGFIHSKIQKNKISSYFYNHRIIIHFDLFNLNKCIHDNIFIFLEVIGCNVIISRTKEIKLPKSHFYISDYCFYFNQYKFLEAYTSLLSLNPQTESYFLKSIRYQLYHKDRLGRLRPNKYLSSKESKKIIKDNFKIWYEYNEFKISLYGLEKIHKRFSQIHSMFHNKMKK